MSMLKDVQNTDMETIGVLQLMDDLEQAKAVTGAKERLLMLHIEEMNGLYEVLHRQVKDLTDANRKSKELFMASMESLARTLEAKDVYTKGHSVRVAEHTVLLADEIGLDPVTVSRLRMAASLHDIGKIGISEKVLNKPQKLTPLEYEIIKRHPIIAEEILQPLEPAADLLPWIRHHHERFDGLGYPDRCAGYDIPIGARIIAITDSFDAMTSDRSYRKGLPLDTALAEIEKGAGTQFDPDLVEAWLYLYRKGRHKRPKIS